VREIRTLRAMWRALETGPRQVLNGHEGGNPGYKPRMSLRATAPVLDPTEVGVPLRASEMSQLCGRLCLQVDDPNFLSASPIGQKCDFATVW
jgi:hypothetical protein